jgi:hypothetical protein
MFTCTDTETAGLIACNSDYYREQAEHYRQLAAGVDDPAAKQEFLELAAACEEAADKMDDCRASG